MLTALGYIAQENGETNGSRQYYERALRSDNTAQEAAGNLAVIEAKEGHLRSAVSLWQMVFKDAPWRSSIGIDIALGYCAANRYEEARAYVKRVLEFNPDFRLGQVLPKPTVSRPAGLFSQLDESTRGLSTFEFLDGSDE